MVCGLNVWPEGGHSPKVDAGNRSVGSAPYPPRIRWLEKKDNPPPDFSDKPHLNVSEKARQIIERLDPGVHQFLPVEFLNSRGKHLESRYWFRVGNRISSLDPERTTLIMNDVGYWRPAKDILRSGKSIPSHIDPEAPAILVFRAEVIGGANFWHEEGLSGTWLTDQTARILQAEGLTGLRLESGKWRTI